MGRRGIQVEVRLLDVLSVIPFRTGQAEESFLQYGIALIPERQREAEPSLPVADTEQAVFAPPVGAAPGVVVREIVPNIAVLGVVLPHRAPLPFGEVGPPPLPVPGPPFILGKPSGFSSRHETSDTDCPIVMSYSRRNAGDSEKVPSCRRAGAALRAVCRSFRIRS